MKITLRTRTGEFKREVEIVSKTVVGKRLTRNRDGEFTYCTALGVDGKTYETTDRNWREQKPQERKQK